MHLCQSILRRSESFINLISRLSVFLILLLVFQRTAVSAEPAPSPELLRTAIAKSLPLLERGAKTSRTERQECFTCHNQGLPIMVLAAARQRGFEIDTDEFQSQLQFTADFLAKNRDRYREGKGQAGQTFMAGYALWALEIGDWKPDETTAAVAEYFLQHQRDADHWSSHTDRPPSETSDFTSNFLGLRALAAWATPAQQDRVRLRREQVRDWLSRAEPKDTEDRVFRLAGLQAAEAAAEMRTQARAALLKSQRPDGGWAQTEAADCDAYATGTVLAVLLREGEITWDAEPVQRALNWLLQHQQADGSWHVVSRSKPFQTYYESGYPHGKDQFISITAGSWATLSLLLALPETKPVP